MKRIILSVTASIFAITFCFSQDIITKKNGDDIKAKVLEVTTTEVKYKKFDNLDGPSFTILKSDVLLIRYENGTKDVFNDDKKSENIPATSPATSDLYAQGKMDASKNYKGYKGAGTGTLITSLVSPIIGLVPAIACSSTEPKDENLDYPSSELMKKSDYYNGYTQKAKKIKQGKVWKNWLIGLGVNIIAVIILTSGG